MLRCAHLFRDTQQTMYRSSKLLKNEENNSPLPKNTTVILESVQITAQGNVQSQQTVLPIFGKMIDTWSVKMLWIHRCARKRERRSKADRRLCTTRVMFSMRELQRDVIYHVTEEVETSIVTACAMFGHKRRSCLVGKSGRGERKKIGVRSWISFSWNCLYRSFSKKRIFICIYALLATFSEQYCMF